MYDLKYHKASSLEEAAQLMEKAEDGKFLSGGQTLIPTMKQRLAAPSDLINLAHLEELKGIKVEGDVLTIGAATTHAEVATSQDVQATIPALASLASGIGDPHVRHMGTMGGSLANNDPAADYPAALLGLNGTVTTNQRTIKADDFFDGLFTTVLEEDEIIVSISFQKPKRAAYEKFDNPASRYALAGVFVAELADGSVRVSVTGAGNDGVFRVDEMETALSTTFTKEALEGIAVDSDDLMEDLHAAADYRAHLIAVMAKRAVGKAV